MPFATEASLERVLLDIPNEKNRTDVRAFLEEKLANGARLTTLVSHANHLRSWARFLGDKTFRDVTKEDVRGFVNRREGLRKHRATPAGGGTPVRISESTMNIRKVLLKSFQRWLRGGGSDDPYPPEVVWLKATRRPDDDVFLDDILTRDDLLQLIQAQETTQHKALLATLYDSGMRAGELTSLRIRDVQIDEHGAILTLPKGANGLKTGARRVRVIHCTPYLIRWLNDHPRRHKPDSALWVGMSRRAPLAPLSPNGLYALVQRAGRKAALQKDIHPHLFRHSRATEAVKEGMRESEMRVYFGWSRTSDMPSRYIHLAGADVEEGILRRAGKLKEGHLHKALLQPRSCLCGRENLPTSEYCEAPACGRPLTVRSAERRERAALDAVLGQLERDSTTLQRLAEELMHRALSRQNSEAPGRGE